MLAIILLPIDYVPKLGIFGLCIVARLGYKLLLEWIEWQRSKVNIELDNERIRKLRKEAWQKRFVHAYEEFWAGL
jgi:hypothetical protein